MGAKTDQDGGSLSYRDAGVDIDAGAALVDAIKPIAARTARPGVMGSLGGFGALFDLAKTGYGDPLLVAATDGVGTKLKIAIDSGLHETVGIDLVAMCVNDLLAQGAEPLFFLDYFASGRLETEVAAAVVAGIAEGCRRAGAALIGGETAEMPGLYGPGDYDLAGFAVGAVERSAVLPRADVVPGDVLIALPSSGPHSNGYSLIRKVTEHAGVPLGAPAPFAPKMSLAKALLVPTEIYVAPILALLKHSSALKAMAHITGGGLPENLPRVLPEGVGARIDLGVVTPPPVFGWLARTGPIEPQEMLRTFNCGVGAVLVVGAADAASALKLLEAEGASPQVIGDLVACDEGPPIRFDGQLELGRS